MSIKAVVGAFCWAMLLSSPTWAASLQPGQGDLSINQGQGFQPVNARVDANVGDAVMVGPGGTATVVYDDGCTVDVQPGAVTSIAPLSPCASGSNADDSSLYAQWELYVAAGGTLGFLAWLVYEAEQTKSATPSVPTSP